MNLSTKYSLGQSVTHLKQNYRGVIIDVDGHFHNQSLKALLKAADNTENNEPWYRILVDESELIAYVRESMLTPDVSNEPIDNPKVRDYLSFDGKKGYKANISLN